MIISASSMAEKAIPNATLQNPTSFFCFLGSFINFWLNSATRLIRNR